MKAYFLSAVLILSALAGLSARAASDISVASCQCQALGPGLDSPDGTQKLCSYRCKCRNQDEIILKNLVSSALSREHWDFGTRVCHGQYAWRPSPASPNWEIVVKFSPFQITDQGDTVYEDAPVATSITVSEWIRRYKTAYEIRDALQRHLSVMKE